MLPEPSQHPDGQVPAQPPRLQQHAGGQLQQRRLAAERGAAHLPCPAAGARQLPDLLRREVPQPGATGSDLTAPPPTTLQTCMRRGGSFEKVCLSPLVVALLVTGFEVMLGISDLVIRTRAQIWEV